MDFFSFRENLTEAKGQGAKAKANIAKLKAGDKVYIEMIVGNQNKPMKMDAEIVSVDASKTPSKAVKAKINKVDGRTVFNAKTETLSANDLAHITKINGKSMKESMDEAAVSKQQQKLFALALAYRKGEVPADEVSDTVKKMAKDVSMKELEKFAGTSHKGLPDKVDEAFSDSQIAKLKKEYEPLRTKKISLDHNKKLNSVIDKISHDKDALEKLYKADIPFVSQTAMVALMLKHNYKAADLNKLMESVEELDEDKRKGLPAHLRKHFDKNGDPVKKGFKFKKAKDVTPKGYGPDESMDEKMDPTKHVNKDGDEYVVVDKNGEEVKRFKDKDTADKYAIDNHDALMES